MSDSARIEVRPRAVANAPATGAPPANPPASQRDSAPPTRTEAAPVVSAERAAAERQVRQTVTDFASALSARKINDVVRLYPRMPRPVQDAWKGLFDIAKDLRVDYRVETVDIVNDIATARVSGQQRFTNPTTKKPCDLPVSLEMKLSQAASLWHITDIKQIGNAPGC